MANDEVRTHLRAALAASVAEETKRLNKLFNDVDTRHAEQVLKMKPLIDALKELKIEIGDVDNVKIEISPYVDSATVWFESMSHKRYEIGTDCDNTCFTVEESSYDPDFEPKEVTHSFSNVHQVLELVVDAIGKRIALNKIVSERNR